MTEPEYFKSRTVDKVIMIKHKGAVEVWLIGLRDYAFSILCWGGPDL